MPRSTTAQVRAKGDEALELVRLGYSNPQIAHALGYRHRSSASRLVHTALRQRPDIDPVDLFQARRRMYSGYPAPGAPSVDE